MCYGQSYDLYPFIHRLFLSMFYCRICYCCLSGGEVENGAIMSFSMIDSFSFIVARAFFYFKADLKWFLNSNVLEKDFLRT